MHSVSFQYLTKFCSRTCCATVTSQHSSRPMVGICSRKVPYNNKQCQIPAAWHCLSAGSFSRSAVNNASGAKTQLAGVITAVIVMFVLLFLTPVFALVPYNAIGAIIIAGCTTLFEWRVAAMLWRVSRSCQRQCVIACSCGYTRGCY
eukprot:GHUV01046260.1.p2 GENE.GHUV01046260.1~~GHUV01046260.1.p2  ORF type:complete len:147 (-),score=18.36 GHUV01046260.1:259-699(-)